jgi:hypothetical protein
VSLVPYGCTAGAAAARRRRGGGGGGAARPRPPGRPPWPCWPGGGRPGAATGTAAQRPWDWERLAPTANWGGHSAPHGPSGGRAPHTHVAKSYPAGPLHIRALRIRGRCARRQPKSRPTSSKIDERVRKSGGGSAAAAESLEAESQSRRGGASCWRRCCGPRGCNVPAPAQ